MKFNFTKTYLEIYMLKNDFLLFIYSDFVILKMSRYSYVTAKDSLIDPPSNGTKDITNWGMYEIPISYLIEEDIKEHLAISKFVDTFARKVFPKDRGNPKNKLFKVCCTMARPIRDYYDDTIELEALRKSEFEKAIAKRVKLNQALKSFFEGAFEEDEGPKIELAVSCSSFLVLHTYLSVNDRKNRTIRDKSIIGAILFYKAEASVYINYIAVSNGAVKKHFPNGAVSVDLKGDGKLESIQLNKMKSFHYLGIGTFILSILQVYVTQIFYDKLYQSNLPVPIYLQASHEETNAQLFYKKLGFKWLFLDKEIDGAEDTKEVYEQRFLDHLPEDLKHFVIFTKLTGPSSDFEASKNGAVASVFDPSDEARTMFTLSVLKTFVVRCLSVWPIKRVYGNLDQKLLDSRTIMDSTTGLCGACNNEDNEAVYATLKCIYCDSNLHAKCFREMDEEDKDLAKLVNGFNGQDISSQYYLGVCKKCDLTRMKANKCSLSIIKTSIPVMRDRMPIVCLCAKTSMPYTKHNVCIGCTNPVHVGCSKWVLDNDKDSASDRRPLCYQCVLQKERESFGTNRKKTEFRNQQYKVKQMDNMNSKMKCEQYHFFKDGEQHGITNLGSNHTFESYYKYAKEHNDEFWRIGHRVPSVSPATVEAFINVPKEIINEPQQQVYGDRIHKFFSPTTLNLDAGLVLRRRTWLNSDVIEAYVSVCNAVTEKKATYFFMGPNDLLGWDQSIVFQETKKHEEIQQYKKNSGYSTNISRSSCRNRELFSFDLLHKHAYKGIYLVLNLDQFHWVGAIVELNDDVVVIEILDTYQPRREKIQKKRNTKQV